MKKSNACKKNMIVERKETTENTIGIVKNKYRYRILGKEGAKLYGHIFPGGKVPIQGIVKCNDMSSDVHHCNCSSCKGWEDRDERVIYLLAYGSLSRNQKTQIREMFVNGYGVPESEFDDMLMQCNNCIPLWPQLLRELKSTK